MKNMTDKSIVQQFDSRRDKVLAWNTLQILHNYAKCNIQRKLQADGVRNFRRKALFKKAILGLKLQQSQRLTKYLYSRLFSVFSAWKTITKESNLLNKYLAECNFKQKAMKNQSHTIEQMGSSSKKKIFQGFNDEDGVFSAGHELVFAAAGQLSFADSVMIEYRGDDTNKG